MIPVIQIKKDLTYSQELSDIIDALKMISSVEFRNLFVKIEKEDVLKEPIQSCFGLLAPSGKRISSFFGRRKGDKDTFLLFCSDEGFLGELNRNITETALVRGKEAESRYIALGERGAKILNDAEVDFSSFSAVDNDITVEKVRNLSNYLIELYTNKKINNLYAVYMKFETFTRHHVNVIKLFPCDELLRFAKNGKTGLRAIDTLIEPSYDSVIQYLIKMWMENTLYNIFWSSKLSEWSIRVMHLEQSFDEIKEITKALRFDYFKSVHSLNDKNIREIFAARAARAA